MLKLLLLLPLVQGELSVIGAGFGRTGTTSLKEALEQLGFGVTHHFKECMDSISWEKGFRGVDVWCDAANAKPMSKERIDILREYFDENPQFHSLLDFPGCLFYREFNQMFPKAKFILSVRDSGEAWWESFANTIGRYIEPGFAWGWRQDPGLWLLFRLNPLFWRSSKLNDATAGPLFPNATRNKEQAIQVYNDHILAVKEDFKDEPERLLVWNIKQGWAPLCKFLNVPVPNTPFPFAPNEKTHVQNMLIVMNVLGFLHLIVPLGVLWFLKRKLCGKKAGKKEKQKSG